MKVKSKKKYTKEFKDQVVALVELGKPPAEVAEEMEVSRDLVYAWKSQAGQRAQLGSGGAGAAGEQAATDRAARASPPGGRPPARKRHFKKSRSDSGHQTPIQQRAMIDSIRQKTGANIRRVCQVLDLPRSTYHAAAKPTATRIDDQMLGDRIEVVFREHRRRYGYRRIEDELRDLGLVCCPTRVRRLMKERGLRALQPKNFIPRTSDGKASRPSSNLLADQPAPSAINQAWAGDRTPSQHELTNHKN